jgi:PAS domain S-box-containing protein
VWGGEDAGSDDERLLARLRTHLENAHRIAGLGSWESDLDAGTMHWSSTARRIFAWPDGEQPAGSDLLEAVHPDDRARVTTIHERAMRLGEPYAIEHRIVRPDGAIRHLHVEVVVERHDDGRPQRLIGTVQDLTDRVALTRRVLDTESRRRELLHRLVQVSDDARADLAAHLHDGPVQVLTATAMRLEHVARTDDSAPAWTRDAVDTVRDVLGQLRDVLFEIHPRSYASGVAATLVDLSATVLPGTEVEVEVTGDEPGPAASRAICGVVQEALWDLREHDRVQTLRLRVATDDGVAVRMSAGDDGPLLSRGGLLGVQERSEALGGRATIDEETGELRCWLPAHDRSGDPA